MTLPTPVAATVPSQEEVFMLPASFGQQRLWFVQQLAPESGAYNLPSGARIRGPIRPEILEKILAEIVRRHEALRTRFVISQGVLQQVIEQKADVELLRADLSSFPEDEREAEARKLAAREVEVPFDLARGPLLRAKLLRISEQDHILMLVMHHTVSDGWSMAVLFREISVLYQSFSAGKPSPLPELPIQYADFGEWQREWLRGPVLEEQLGYWKKQLAGIQPLELPIDRPRAAFARNEGAYFSFWLPRQLSKKLQERSQRSGATLFMTMLAGFQLLLSRYSGQNDIAVGTFIAGRRLHETESLIGLFVNTLVLRSNLSGEPEVLEFIQRVKDVTLEAYAHQDIPFERLVEALHPQRDLTRAPLFQVAMVFQNLPTSRLELGEAKLEPLELPIGTAKYEFLLGVSEGATGIRCSLEYNADLFDAATVAGVGRHFQTLLQGMVDNPSFRLSQLPSLTEAERNVILDTWRSEVAGPLRSQTICQLLMLHTARQPDAAAIFAGEEELSYRQLSLRVDQWARRLQSMGMRRGSRAGVYLNRGADWAVAVLAVLKAGGVFVDLDPSAPAARLAYILSDSDPLVLLTEESLAKHFQSGRVPLLILDGQPQRSSEENNQWQEIEINADDLAGLLYRSGPSGRPEGLLFCHRALVPAAFDSELAFKAADRIAQTVTLSHETTCFELFATLAAGACIVEISSQLLSAPRKLANLFRDGAVTVVVASAAVLERLAQEFPYALNSVRLLLCDDQPSAVHRLREKCQAPLPERIYGLYGSTETGGRLMMYPVSKMTFDAQRMPAGFIAEGAALYLLNEQLEPVPDSICGEIYIKSGNMALAYDRQGPRTADTFVADPFTKTPGERLLRTGDLGRKRWDGSMEYCGRRDHRSFVEGLRVEQKELETVLEQHPAVRAAVVMAAGISQGPHSGLTAFVVPHDGAIVTAGELRNFMRERLPKAMVPQMFNLLDAVPVTAGGSVDRTALIEKLQNSSSASTQVYIEPRDQMERSLAAIWAQVLGADKVGIHDNFFNRGGHSLLAAQVIARTNSVFHVRLPMRRLFEAPTIAGLAAVIRELQATRKTEDFQPAASQILVEMKSGSGIPFFCVHPVGGDVLCYRNLAAEIGLARPFYAFRAPEADGEAASDLAISIPKMAAIYIQEMRRAQPRGPYALGGWSMGGLVAFEMARQLRQEGETLALLALFDTYAPTTNPPPAGQDLPANDDQFLLAAFAADMGRLMGKDLGELHRQFLQTPEHDRRAFVFDALRAHGVLAPDTLNEEIAGYLDIFMRNYHAAVSYQPEPIQDRIVFIRAADSEMPESLAHEWRLRTSDKVDFHVVAGDHYGILSQVHAPALGKILKHYLEELELTASNATNVNPPN
jgi:amino acid adenylation domain-containing protein